MDFPTPRLAQLLLRLATQSSELQKNIETLNKRLGLDSDVLVLQPAVNNIVDRKKEKERHKKRWKITIKEVVDSGIEYDTLDKI
jgi:hypothetical protein